MGTKIKGFFDGQSMEEMRGKKNFLFLLLIAFGATFAFVPAIKAPFFYDDFHTIVNNPYIRHPKSYIDFFVEPKTFSVSGAKMYRPFTQLSFAINWRAGGYDTFGYHLVNVLAHLICSILVFFLSRKIVKSENLSFVCALLFAFHPTRVQPVNYLSARSELFASLFYVGSILCFIKADEQNRRRYAFFFGVLANFLYICGLCSKDIAVSVPFVFLIYIFLWRRLNLRSVLLFLSGLSVFVSYFVLRRSLSLYSFFPPSSPRDVLTNLFTQTRMLIHYLWILIFPIHLSVEHRVRLISKFFDIEFIFSFLFFVLVFIVFLFRRIKKPIYLFSFLWFFAIISPSSSIVPLVVLGSETRLYLPALGFFWIVVELSREVLEKQVVKCVAFAILVFLSFFVQSFYVSHRWNSTLKLWTETIKVVPSLARAHNNLGIELEKKGNITQALREYNFALKVDPKHSQAYGNLGNYYFDRGDYELAELNYKKAIEFDPTDVFSRFNYAQLLLARERPEPALSQLEKALTISPDWAELHLSLGTVYLYFFNEDEKALYHLRRALELDPLHKDRDNIIRTIKELERDR